MNNDNKQDCVESFSKWASEYKEYIGNQSGYDQSVKYDGNKRRVEFLPDLSILIDIAEVFEAGERKGYARDSWQNVEYERYRASFLRHIIAWWREEHSIDEETELEHFQLMLCNMYMLWWLRRNRVSDEGSVSCKTEVEK